MNEQMQVQDGLQGTPQPPEEFDSLEPDYEGLATIHPDSDADLNQPILDDQAQPEPNGATGEGSQPDEALEDLGLEGQAAPKEGEESSEGDQVQVKLDDGTELTLNELERGYLRERDYTQKTERLAADRREVEASAQLYQQGYMDMQARNQELMTFIESLIPQDVDVALMQQNPQEYLIQKELNEKARQELDRIRQTTWQGQQYNQQINNQRMQGVLEREEFLLTNLMPKLKEPKARQEFMQNTMKAGQDLGFQANELNAIYDHRLIRTLHYARLGMAAERNRQNVGKAQQAPSRATNRGPRRGKHLVTPQGGNAARTQFQRTRTLEDAAMLDIDI